MTRSPEAKRFLVASIAGVMLINIFYFLLMVFPSLLSWLMRLGLWGFSAWFMFGGLVTGVVVGVLAKNWKTGIGGALVSVFVGGWITVVVMYPPGNVDFWHGLSLGIILEACIPAIVGSILGTLIMKKVINRTASLERS